MVKRDAAPARRKDGGLGGDVVPGRQAVRELLRTGRRRVRQVRIANGTEDSELVDEIVSLARDRGVPIRTGDRASVEREAGVEVAQGVVAIADSVSVVEIEELLSEETPFLLALDGVTDPQNLGAILRTASCAGVTGVLLPGHRSARLSPAAVKASAGGIEHLRFALVSGIPAAMRDLKRNDVWTVGLDMTGDQSIFDVAVLDQSVALVLGSEGEGISDLARKRCDVVARVPQVAGVESLNVAAAGAVAMFEVVRRRM